MSSTPWGVDLSPTYNPTVDAAAIAAAGASYAILKVSEGVGWPDAAQNPDEFAWFDRVAADVVDAGLALRVYHLATPLDVRDASAEAVWFDRHLGPAMPASIAYDLEKIPPGMLGACADIFEAWSSSVAGFLPSVPIEFYSDQSVYNAIAPFLPAAQRVWLGWPGWTPDDAMRSDVVRVQIGKRVFPSMPDHPVDINVDPRATSADLAEALGFLPPRPAPAPPRPAPAPPSSSDWSLPVQTLDLRNAAMTPVRAPGVKALQTLLNLALGIGLAIDGVGGPATRTALLTFQERHGLAPDCQAGPVTWGALCRQ